MIVLASRFLVLYKILFCVNYLVFDQIWTGNLNLSSLRRENDVTCMGTLNVSHTYEMEQLRMYRLWFNRRWPLYGKLKWADWRVLPETTGTHLSLESIVSFLAATPVLSRGVLF